MLCASSFYPVGPRNGIRGTLLLYLPRFALAEAEVLVAPRVGGTAESDLVPRPRMRVVGVAGVAHPELEQTIGWQAVPVAVEATHPLD